MIVSESILKSHLGGVQSKLSWGTVSPFMFQADRWFRLQVGPELYDFLKTITTTEENPDIKDLLWLAQGAIVWYGYGMAQPNLHIKSGDSGFAKFLPANHVAITKWEYVKLEENTSSMIDLNLEGFWIQLSALAPEDLPGDWVGSDAFKVRNSLFIRSATELTTFLPLAKGSVRMYEALKHYINQAEKTYIESLITTEVMDDLKKKLREDVGFVLTADDIKLIELIGYALAPLAMYEALPYLAVLVDTEGVRMVVKTDSTRNEIEAGIGEKNRLIQKLHSDGEMCVGRIKRFLKKKASTTVYAAYYNANLETTYQGSLLDLEDTQSPIL